MITLVIAEDHTLVRQGLRTIFELEPDMTVVGEASDGLEAVRVTLAARPNVLVVDMALPRLRGPEVIAQVRRETQDVRAVALSMHADEAYVVQALRNGADAYVLKDESADTLVAAVRDAIGGRRYLSSAISERAIQFYVDSADCAHTDGTESLTDREREVLRLAAEGLSNPAIASLLFISTRTVETHRASLMRKLGLRNQSDLIRFAIRTGMTDMT